VIALIIARPGMLRDGLSGLLSAVPEIKVVSVAANLESALESVAGSCPSIVLLEAHGLDAYCLTQVQALKITCPRTGIIVLVEDLKEAQACEEGAVDAVLTKGVPPARLSDTISELLRFSSTAESKT
jgi:DNA-binding NarL/FixJ family response regulator